MVFRPLAGVLLAFFLAPSAANRAGSPAPVAPPARSRHPAAGGARGGECVRAISYGRRDRLIGIVQA